LGDAMTPTRRSHWLAEVGVNISIVAGLGGVFSPVATGRGGDGIDTAHHHGCRDTSPRTPTRLRLHLCTLAASAGVLLRHFACRRHLFLPRRTVYRHIYLSTSGLIPYYDSAALRRRHSCIGGISIDCSDSSSDCPRGRANLRQRITRLCVLHWRRSTLWWHWQRIKTLAFALPTSNDWKTHAVKRSDVR